MNTEFYLNILKKTKLFRTTFCGGYYCSSDGRFFVHGEELVGSISQYFDQLSNCHHLNKSPAL
jgi:hypothetical protein